MKGIATLLTAGLLAGCSSVVSDPNEQQVSPGTQAQTSARPYNYRQIAADKLPLVLKGISLIGAEISELGPSTGAQPGDWETCVKTNTFGKTEYFATFYIEGKVLDVRRAIMTDKCPLGVYSLLPSKTPTPKETKDH